MSTPKSKTKTLADFRALHDKKVIIPNKIKAAFAKMAAAGEEWHYESDFEKLAGISHADITKAREEFAKHVVAAQPDKGRAVKIVWFVDPKVAAKAQGE